MRLLPILALFLAACGSSARADPIHDATMTCRAYNATPYTPANSTDDDVLSHCGLHITSVAGGYSLVVDANALTDNDGLVAFGKSSGCFTALDVTNMGQTRVGDGRLTSGNGRSSWINDAGLGMLVTCKK